MTTGTSSLSTSSLYSTDQNWKNTDAAAFDRGNRAHNKGVDDKRTHPFKRMMSLEKNEVTGEQDPNTPDL